MGQGAARLKAVKKENPTLDWQIVDDLGSGTYGKVHRVRHRTSREEAAAKIAPIKSDEQLLDFSVEIAILSTCSHPNITNFVSSYYYENNLWILIEICSGGSLADILRHRKSGLSETQIKCICHQMLLALDFLHSRFIIHRDINASNTLLGIDGTVKLADFGVSAKDRNDSQRHITFIGSPNWMAPEVVVCENDQSKPYGAACDIWSLAVTMIELGDGRAPFADLHPMKVLFRIAGGKPPQLQQEDLFSANFVEFLNKSLIKNPADRPTATSLLQHPFARDQNDKDALEQLVKDKMAGSRSGSGSGAAAGSAAAAGVSASSQPPPPQRPAPRLLSNDSMGSNGGPPPPRPPKTQA